MDNFLSEYAAKELEKAKSKGDVAIGEITKEDIAVLFRPATDEERRRVEAEIKRAEKRKQQQ